MTKTREQRSRIDRDEKKRIDIHPRLNDGGTYIETPIGEIRQFCQKIEN